MHSTALIILLASSVAIATPVMTRQTLNLQMSREQYCLNMIRFNNFYYVLEETRNISGFPADMSMQWKNNNLFFTHITDEMELSLQILSSSGDLQTIKVAGIGQSTAVDNLNDIIYLATDKGVYKYKEDGSIESFSALDKDVMYIAVTNDGDTVYIATFPQNVVYKITSDGNIIEPFPAITNGHGLTIDPRNNIYYHSVATKTLYVLQSGHDIPMKIKGLPSDRMISGIFVSRSDEVFAMDVSSNLYSIDGENAVAKHIAAFGLNGVNTFAMDHQDNVLIGVKGAILKYKANDQNPCPAGTKKGKRHSGKRRRKHKITTTTTSTTEPTSEYEEEPTEREDEAEKKR